MNLDKELEAIGAAWAVRSDKYIAPEDPFGAKPSYHIHRDRYDPDRSGIKRFETRKQLENWIRAVKTCPSGKTVVYVGDGEYEHE